jgi:hypothetical protein
VFGRSAPLALALLTVTGCGSSGTKTVTVATSTPSAATTTTATITKTKFIARADPICRESGEKMKPLLDRAKNLRGESEAKEAPAVIRHLVTIQRAFVARLRALPEPPADRAVISKMLAALDESATDGKKLGEAAATGDVAAEIAAHGIAKGYGFKVCGASE